MSTPAISCRGLLKRYGQQLAVAGIDLDVKRGECFGLLGPNGAGKTTTVEMLEGLTEPDAGHLELLGMPWKTGQDQRIRERIGVQLQETTLADKLEVIEVLRLFRSFYTSGCDVDDLIRLLQLEPERHKRFHKLSGGQRQRVALGCALVGSPDILFLDEPTTGLDPRARQTLWAVVEKFREGGGTVMLTTHYMDEAAQLCDRIAIMDHGKIIAEGTPRSLIDGLGLVQFVEFECEGHIDRAALTEHPEVTSVEQRGERVRLTIARSLTALRVVLEELERQHVTPVGLSAHQATLDDVFLGLTGRKLQTETEPDSAADSATDSAAADAGGAP